MAREIGFSVAEDIRAFVDYYADQHATTASAMAKRGMMAEMKRHPLKQAQLEEYERKYGPPPLACVPVRPVRPDGYIKKTSDSSSNPEEANKQEAKYLELYHSLEKAFLSRNGDRFTNYDKEGKSIKALIAKATERSPEDPAGLLRSMLAAFWSLKQGREQFWRGQPFLPSALNAGGIWDRVLESMRRDELDPEVARLIREAP